MHSVKSPKRGRTPTKSRDGRDARENCSKILEQRVAQKKIPAYGKNIPAREMLTKKIVQLENYPPPTNFSNGPFLRGCKNTALCILCSLQYYDVKHTISIGVRVF